MQIVNSIGLNSDLAKRPPYYWLRFGRQHREGNSYVIDRIMLKLADSNIGCCYLSKAASDFLATSSPHSCIKCPAS